MDKIEVTPTTAYEAFAHYSAGDMLTMISLTAPNFKHEIRAPIDTVAVIDKSGSMNGVKLELVKKTLNFMINALQNEDKFSIVTFDTTARTDLPLTLLNDAGKVLANEVAAKISSGSDTDLCGGLLEGVNELRKREKTADVSSVLLFTDGLANAGITTSIKINRALIDPAFAGTVYANKSVLPDNSLKQTTVVSNGEISLPCNINTFGYGADHDPELLKSIAEKSNGMYFFVEKPEEIPKTFADCLGGLLSTVAKDVVIRIEAGTGIVIKKILTKYSTTEIAAGGVYEIKFSDIQSQEHRDILMMLHLPAVPQPFDQFPIAKICVSYFNVITKQQVNLPDVCLLKIARPAQTEPNLKVNYNIDKQYNRIIAADAMASATDLGNNNKLDEAKEILRNAKNRIKESVSANDEFCQGLVTDLERCATGLQSKETYTSYGHQSLSTNSASHYQQRSSNIGYVSQAAYQTSARYSMGNKFTEDGQNK
jgi:hypothetical protein